MPESRRLVSRCRRGELGMVRSLLEHRADANAIDARRLTPLLVTAASAGEKSYHHMVAGELVKAGGTLVARDANGDTPLHLAVRTAAQRAPSNPTCPSNALADARPVAHSATRRRHGCW